MAIAMLLDGRRLIGHLRDVPRNGDPVASGRVTVARMRGRSVRLVAAAALVATPLAVGAQDVRQVSGPPACQGACLSINVVQTIDSPPEVGFDAGDIARAGATPGGDLFIAPEMLPGIILRFRDGSQLGRLGRRGQGPGESMGIMSLAVGRDSVHAFSPLSRNVFAEDSSGFRSQRDALVPIRSNVVFEGGEVHLAMTPQSMAVDAARIFKLPRGQGMLDSATPVETSIEPASVGESLILDSTSSRCLAVGYHGRYRVDIHDADLDLVTTVEREVPWFEPWETWVPPTEGPSPTRMESVMLDCDRRLLWVLMFVAEDEGFEPLPPPEEVPLGPLHRRSRVIDAVVEVIDLERLSVVAHQRFDGALGPFLHGGHVLEPHVSASGDQGFRVLRLSLPEAR